MVNLLVLYTVLITVLGVAVLGLLVGVSILLYKNIRRSHNPIDFFVLEMHKNNLRLRKEIGRRVFDINKGYRYVTTGGFRAFGRKDDLGYMITDDHLYGGIGKRKTCIVAIKDGIPAPVDLNAKDLKQLSDSEKLALKTLSEKKIIPVSIEIPESLSITPIPYEATRLVFDIEKDRIEMYKKPLDNLQKLAAIAGLTIFGLCVIGVIVVIVLGLTLGGDFITEQKASSAPPPAPTSPLISLPSG